MQKIFHGFLSLVEFKKAYQLKSSGLNYIQLHVLEKISRMGESKTLDISKAMGISPSTLIGVLDELERLKLIKRERQQKDKRVVLVTITLDGQEKVGQHEAEDERFLCNLTSCMNKHEQESFFALLDRMVKGVKKPEDLFL